MNKFRLEIRKFLIIRPIKISNSLPTGIVEAKKNTNYFKDETINFWKTFYDMLPMTAEDKLYNLIISSLSSEISPTSAEMDLDSCRAKPKSSTARGQKSSHCGWGGLDCFHWSCNLLLTEQDRSWQISLTSPIALLQNVTDLSSMLGILSPSFPTESPTQLNW